MRPNRLIPIAILLCLCSAPLEAQDDAAPTVASEEALHDELRALRQELVAAVLAGDIEQQLRHAHPEIVVTWQHGKVVRGHDGLRGFLDEIGAEQGDTFKGYTLPPTPADLTILHGGDLGITWGTSIAQYELAGQSFELENHWTATLVRDDAGAWQIAAYHVSADMLDNPLLNAAKDALLWAGGIGGLIGLVLGLILGAVLRGRRKTAPPAMA